MSFKAVNTVAQKTTTPAVDATVLPVQQDFVQIKKPDKKLQAQGIYVQPKLTVGAPDDPYEKEADVVADKVMRMPEQNFVQRKCADCEKEEKLHRKPISESITPMIQTKGESNATVNNATANTIYSTKGNGSALDSNTQSFMSTRFGADFSGVKIHTDSEAIQLNRNLNAKAFTVGNDVYFNEGQYQPGSLSGKHLLAHELTHVVQQGNSQAQVQRACGPKQIKGTKECHGLGSDLEEYANSTDDTYKFRVSCDEFLPGEEERFRSKLREFDSGQRIDVHGFASEEGSQKFNDTLSCARAVRAWDISMDEGVWVRYMFNHGEKKGIREELRSVVIELVPEFEEEAISSSLPPDPLPVPVVDKPFKIPCCLFENEIAYAKALAIGWTLGQTVGHKVSGGDLARPNEFHTVGQLQNIGYSYTEAQEAYDNVAGKYMSTFLGDSHMIPHIDEDIANAQKSLKDCDPSSKPPFCSLHNSIKSTSSDTDCSNPDTLCITVTVDGGNVDNVPPKPKRLLQKWPKKFKH